MRVHVSGRVAGVATLGLSMVLVVGACSGSAAPSRALDVPPSSAADGGSVAIGLRVAIGCTDRGRVSIGRSEPVAHR